MESNEQIGWEALVRIIDVLQEIVEMLHDLFCFHIERKPGHHLNINTREKVSGV